MTGKQFEMPKWLLEELEKDEGRCYKQRAECSETLIGEKTSSSGPAWKLIDCQILEVRVTSKENESDGN